MYLNERRSADSTFRLTVLSPGPDRLTEHVFVRETLRPSGEPSPAPGADPAPEPPPWLASLNDAQREAVTCQDRTVLVVAGAGTGKTMTLACRVAWLVASGVPPERILLLTFTRRAAREMLARAARMIGSTGATTGRGSGRVWGGTFHAAANRLLRGFGHLIGLRPDFTVMDQADAADLMNLIRGERLLGERDHRFPRKDTLAAIYSRTVNAQIRLAEVLARDYPWCSEEIGGIREVFGRYVERKRAANVLDYDDLLLYWRELATAPLAGPRVAALFDHVLVDEYQDTNAVQADVLSGLYATGGCTLTVVGDDAQAIYSFRSATVRNILDFPSSFPGTRVIRLEQNYRSTPPVLNASNAVISLARERHEKTLWSARAGAVRPMLLTHLDEAGQADAVCAAVLDARERGCPLKRQAVLFRAAHHSDLLEIELSRRNIPFVKYGGLKFLEAAHVKDVLAILRILENPRDEVSWFRVLQLLDGVGPATARRLAAALGVGNSGNEPDGVGSQVDASPSPLRRLLDSPPPVPAAAREGFDALREVVSLLDDRDGASPRPPVATQVERIGVFLEPAFARLYANAPARLRDVEQLANIASGSSSRARFLTDLTLDPPASTGDLAGPPHLDEDWLVLSTIHSAKGCEWDEVHVIHASDGCIPSDMATGDAEQIEEERRLLYVAMTRARDRLTVHFPLRYHVGGRRHSDRHSYAQLSRFLPPAVVEHFEQRTSFEDDADPIAAGRRVGARSGAGGRIDEFLSNLWSD
jgi:DNA helicase II / ATP-dependent DNA helicase PcrA